MDPYEPAEINENERLIMVEVQSKIYSCPICQPYDSGEAVWIHGDRTDIIELFEDHELSDDQIERICTHLCCPSCGAENFDSTSEIGLKLKRIR